ncbi:uncharacterized protein BYT42DRAFT_544673 [Radiomyces spectabilis]|uniref:uncharacterized protein n=1 Tax=Radiomyces spectabilis TaxID=64574 RepID=UPI002220C728|nr:uncharacterized protein BYT42DRAFT_544673 [Radiomyces spectabilis]KAI8384840.1 hypothetical protein BYT42DRAFT_544673 [Radiomyces spectabilis]
MTESDAILSFEFDDDIFVSSDEKAAKKEVLPEKIDYVAKQDTEGWFYTKRNHEEVMLDRHGPNQLKNAVEYDYLHKRYDRALDTGLLYIRVAESSKECKVSNTREMSEIVAHCAAKLGRYDILEQMLDRKQTRKLDYRVWRQIAAIMMGQANPMRCHVAHLAITRALYIMTSTRWKTSIDIVRQRHEKEKQQLQEEYDHIEKQGGDLTKFIAWMHNATGTEDLKQVGLDTFAWDDLVWIYGEWTKRKDTDTEKDNEEQGVRPVREL